MRDPQQEVQQWAAQHLADTRTAMQKAAQDVQEHREHHARLSEAKRDLHGAVRRLVRDEVDRQRAALSEGRDESATARYEAQERQDILGMWHRWLEDVGFQKLDAYQLWAEVTNTLDILRGWRRVKQRSMDGRPDPEFLDFVIGNLEVTWERAELLVARPVSETPHENGSVSVTTDDMSRDNAKKSVKKRMMTAEASDCARIYRDKKRVDDTVKMSQIVQDYVSENGGSYASITRVLNDNPDQWKQGLDE